MTDMTPETTSGTESETKARRRRTLQVAAESRDAAVVSVYDPAMCCPTGVRGPSVEPEFARISKDLRWVESQGAKVERFNLAQEPEAFVQNRRVVGLMQAFGDGALPAVLVNGEVAAYGRYPSREEMLEAAKGSVGGGVGAGQTDEQAPRSSGCEPGSGCC